MPAQQPWTPIYVLKDVASCPSLEDPKRLIEGLVFMDNEQTFYLAPVEDSPT